ncbi:TRAF-interacting protein with FHA domain-containing protein B [Ornithorhynchus anatinus]|uniref:TRAF-interacting protein with FHA domain-containing protein B n=1 Tax=Ornithorhynchus anatinus TaxID=9258 RepID=UPI0007AA75B8|nr:TRAF-interacting protein with FHA domain-containing protein B [Ornithorhynchus anatinus]
MEKSVTILQIYLHHPQQDSGIFRDIPQCLHHDDTNLLFGRGHDAHLKFRLPGISRQHMCLEPYLEKGNVSLGFCLKILSKNSKVWVNGFSLKYLQQVPLTDVSQIMFAGIQMVIHIEAAFPGKSLLATFISAAHL